MAATGLHESSECLEAIKCYEEAHRSLRDSFPEKVKATLDGFDLPDFITGGGVQSKFAPLKETIKRFTIARAQGLKKMDQSRMNVLTTQVERWYKKLYCPLRMVLSVSNEALSAAPVLPLFRIELCINVRSDSSTCQPFWVTFERASGVDGCLSLWL